mmetsp:Transcript_58013/g.95794  ORF Transcript_58013/g.95794 Transcript_58013/m.95794 type:complete len:134 (+) Transcript_58013:1-402(+)
MQLGPDFQNAVCLMNAEVALILENKLASAQDLGQQPKSEFVKTLEYVNRVKQYKDKETTQYVRRILRRDQSGDETLNLEEFELAQLGNLSPEDADEAKVLVPSLAMPGRPGGDVEPALLTEALQEISSSKHFT